MSAWKADDMFFLSIFFYPSLNCEQSGKKNLKRNKKFLKNHFNRGKKI